ncbi:MAG: hypothetical protein DI596_03170 [Azospira oryzae]|nr:MAG: hypothetical protein DI596_03170 [Azospira oryzae]PZP81894.1 MAG: hypothetical protein DI593_03170 [Azospira oryzae]
MSAIPEFSEAELWVVESALKERYGRDVPVEVAVSEIQLDPASPALTPCPTLHWTQDSVGFVINKIAEHRYRAQFYYSVHDQYGTDREAFDDLGECVGVLLKLQADTAKDRAGATSGADGSRLSSPFTQFIDF